MFVHRDERRKIVDRKTSKSRELTRIPKLAFFLTILLKGQSNLFLTKPLSLLFKRYIISLLSFSQNCITASSCQVTLPDLGRISVDFSVRSFCNQLRFLCFSPPSSHLRKLCCSVWTTCLRQLKPLPDFHGLAHYSAVSLSWSGSSMNWIRQRPGSRFHQQLGPAVELSGFLKFVLIFRDISSINGIYFQGFSDVCTSLVWSDRFNQHLIACSVSTVCSQSELILLYSIVLWLCGWLFCIWSVLFGGATDWKLMILWNFLCCDVNESIYVEKDQLSSERF